MASKAHELAKITPSANAAYYRDIGQLVKWCVRVAINDRRFLGMNVNRDQVKLFIRDQRELLCGASSLKKLNQQAAQATEWLESLPCNTGLGGVDMIIIDDSDS